MHWRWKKVTQAASRKIGGEGPHGRPKMSLEDNVTWDLKEVDYEGNWKILAQDRVTWRAYVLVIMNLRIP